MIDKEIQIICSGFGGQGILTLGLILAKTAMDAGKEVTWLPSYGSEMRGGTASCNIKISNTGISSPFIRCPDILVGLNEPSISKFEDSVTPGGIILVNSSIVGDRSYRDDIAVYGIKANDVAAEVGNMRGAGITMIGALIKVYELFDKDDTRTAINRFFESKGKNNPLNQACFDMGYEKVYKISPNSD